MKQYFTILLFFISCISIYPQNKEKVLAKAGKVNITEEQFIDRFELSPQVGLQEKGPNETLKSDFLYTLIAEKLWAQKAHDLHLDTTRVMRLTFKTIEKMYVRDALYKLEVHDKVKIPQEEYVKGYFKAGVKLKLDYLVTNTEKEIMGLHHMLDIGVPFDTLLYLRRNIQPDTTFEVTFGTMQEPIEDSVYKLAPGQYTSPIPGPTAWYIFRLKERGNAITNAKDQENITSKVKKILENRETDKIYSEFYRKFFSGIKVNSNGELFWSLADKLAEALKEKKEKEKIADGQKIYLGTDDEYKIADELGPDTLKMNFIEFKKNPVTVEQFFREFMFAGFYSTSADPDTVRRKLHSRVKQYIEQELLAREGYKRGLQNLPDVKNNIEMWRENYLSTLLRIEFVDSSRVSDDEVRDYYNQTNKEKILPDQVNIVEILTDSLDTVAKILDEINNNADMHELARKYTKRTWTKDNGGEFGFFPVTMYGEIGKIASSMKIGEVYGPLKVPEGYSIFKLIDKKQNQKSEPKPFEDVKTEMKKNLSYKKYNDVLTDYTVKLADEYGVSVNEDALKNVKVTNIPMFVYKYFGFGGRLPAVPLASPFHEWMKEWKENKQELP